MGTKMAPTYATLVMGYLEKQLYEKFEEKYGNHYKEELIKLFNDIWMTVFFYGGNQKKSLRSFTK